MTRTNHHHHGRHDVKGADDVVILFGQRLLPRNVSVLCERVCVEEADDELFVAELTDNPWNALAGNEIGCLGRSGDLLLT